MFFSFLFFFFFIPYYAAFLFRECDGFWSAGGGGEEKGTVLGQADRDVSTASVIL